MAGETVITVVGNLVDDPELRFTPSGAPVCNFRIASTPRTFDRQTNEWKDGDALFLGCSVWRQPAENCAETLQKGMRVIVQGRLKSRSYETREGERRTVFEIDVDEVGLFVRRPYACAAVKQRGHGAGAKTRPVVAPRLAKVRQSWLRPARLRPPPGGDRAARRRRAAIADGCGAARRWPLHTIGDRNPLVPDPTPAPLTDTMLVQRR